MKRRALLAAPVLALPMGSARAQPSAMRVVGYLHPFSEAYMTPFADAVRRGLAIQGFEEGRNLRLEFRTANGHYEKLPALARELVERKVDAILAAGGSDPAKAAKEATATIPIVFVSGADPVRGGLVPNLNRPGGNVTGVSLFGSSLEGKRLEYLSRLVPGAGALGALINPKYPDAELQAAEFSKAADLLKRPIAIERASAAGEIETAFAAARQQGVAGLAVAQDPLFNSRRSEIVRLADRYRLPAIYNQREYVERGGLVSYGTRFSDGYRQAGVYLGRILNGAAPAELPVTEPLRFELVLNAATARTLGLAIPADMLAGAEEVIE